MKTRYVLYDSLDSKEGNVIDLRATPVAVSIKVNGKEVIAGFEYVTAVIEAQTNLNLAIKNLVDNDMFRNKAEKEEEE